jgi:hypothetical protein
MSYFKVGASSASIRPIESGVFSKLMASPLSCLDQFLG